MVCVYGPPLAMGHLSPSNQAKTNQQQISQRENILAVISLLSLIQIAVSYHDGCSCSATDTSKRTTRSVPATQLSTELCFPPFVLSHLITLLMKMNRIGQQVLPQITESQSNSPLVVSSRSLQMDIPLCDIHFNSPYLDSTQVV